MTTLSYPSPGTLLVENASISFPCFDWVAGIGLPSHYPPTRLTAVDKDGNRFPAVVAQKLAFVRVPLTPGEIRELAMEPARPDDGELTYEVHPWVGDEPARLYPRLFAVIDGVRCESLPPVVVTRSDWLPALRRAEFTVRWAGYPLVGHGHMDVFTGQSVVEWEVTLSYGTTQEGQDFIGKVSGVSMLVGEYPVVDYRARKGLHFPVWRADVDAYEVELATASTDWTRARKVWVRGALLCMPAHDRIAGAAQSAGALAMRYRQEAPPYGIAGGMAEHLSPFGILPELSPAAREAERQAFWSAVSRRLHTPGREDDPREFAQPPYSGTTGRQPDFGAISAGVMHAVAYGRPAALHHLLYDAEGDLRRPLHNVEHDTSRPVAAADHPGTQTFIGGPFPPLSGDMLGWPRNIPWINGYSLPDDEHRAGRLVRNLYMLTRRRAIGAHIHDQAEMDMLAYWRRRTPTLGQGVGSPRQWRMLINWCLDHMAGFTQAATLIKEAIDYIWTQAAWQVRSPTAEIQVLEERIHKYGWTTGDATPILGWWPWMEAEAIVAARMADLLGINAEKAREIVLRSARTIARHGFYQHSGRWWCAYSVRSQANGAALDAACYWPAEGQNPDVFTYDAMSEWSLQALDILLFIEPDGPDAPRCREIIAAYPKPTTWIAAVQRAVR